MTIDAISDITRDALYLIIKVSLPILSDRFDCQYFSDSYLYTRADTYICAENYLCIFGIDAFRKLDVKQYSGVYDYIVV